MTLAYQILSYLLAHGDESVRSMIMFILEREAIRRNLRITAGIRERTRFDGGR